MLRKIVLAELLAFSLISLNGAQLQSVRQRLSRRQRILSILESFQDQQPTAPTFHAARFNFEAGSGSESSSRGRSGVASDRAISHYSSPVQAVHSSGWNGQGPSPNRTTPPPTVEPPESPYDLWYYQVISLTRISLFVRLSGSNLSKAFSGLSERSSSFFSLFHRLVGA